MERSTKCAIASLCSSAVFFIILILAGINPLLALLGGHLELEDDWVSAMTICVLAALAAGFASLIALKPRVKGFLAAWVVIGMLLATTVYIIIIRLITL